MGMPDHRARATLPDILRNAGAVTENLGGEVSGANPPSQILRLGPLGLAQDDIVSFPGRREATPNPKPHT